MPRTMEMIIIHKLSKEVRRSLADRNVCSVHSLRFTPNHAVLFWSEKLPLVYVQYAHEIYKQTMCYEIGAGLEYITLTAELPSWGQDEWLTFLEEIFFNILFIPLAFAQLWKCELVMGITCHWLPPCLVQANLKADSQVK